MKAPPQYISKTNFLAGDQCPKLQWIKVRDRDRMPPIDAQTQAIFAQGHEIGNLAKSLFPDGIEVAEGEYRYGKVIDETNSLLPINGRLQLARKRANGYRSFRNFRAIALWIAGDLSPASDLPNPLPEPF